ncbi:PQQ-binding-like beta-propeller repeat protein [Paenibacillus albidus]|uniref:outer membrane protein assembly factor BamB family protein n=1 Tax=Paenibacillus albidus TaxID=2041023 RepID=UPI001BEAC0EE|nr:PQQ-binding-like beta-propeller repeat protein [Paenibacillus albidus]MBT2288360.1 PQQ-binding-like beta-propeller repeat protein [Paenibacillus albidus]
MNKIYRYTAVIASSILAWGMLSGCSGTAGNRAADKPDAALAAPAETTAGSSARTAVSAEAQTDEGKQVVPKSMELQRYAPFFVQPYPAEAKEKLDVFFYAEPGTEYDVVEKSGEWLAFNTEYGKAWVPEWYTEEAAADITLQEPEALTSVTGAKLSLRPGSGTTWTADQWKSSSSGGQWISLLRWRDWHGALLVPKQLNNQYRVIRPALLWIRDSDIASRKQVGSNLGQSGLAPDTIRAIVDIALPAGSEPSAVAKLLGEPDFKEDSFALNYTGEPLRVGKDWRYETMDPQLTATFSELGKLEHLTWDIQPKSRQEMQVSSYQGLFSSYHLRTIEAVSSKAPNWTWRHQGDLAFTYLRYGTPEHLLIAGDDGGLSGMHDDSSLYALDRASGRKLWQINAGYGGSFTTLDESGQYLTVLTPLSPDKKEYNYHLRRLRMADGSVVWEKYLPQEKNKVNFSAMAGVGEGIIVYGDSGDNSDFMVVSGLNAVNGKPLWTKQLESGSRIMNSGNEPYVLIRNMEKLTALDPDTGAAVWTVQGKRAALGEEPYEDMVVDYPQRLDPFKGELKERWFLLGKERLRVDLQTGKVISRYTPKPAATESVVGWNGSVLLVQEDTNKLDKETNYDETYLLDTATGKELWRKKGSAAGAFFAGEKLYLFLNGAAAALDVQTGKELWKQQVSELAYTRDDVRPIGMLLRPLGNGQLLMASGQDLILLRESDGSMLYRIGDAVIDYPEARDNDIRSGVIVTDGQDIYLGSGNGKFSRLTLPLP